ncbi:ABC transporter permease [Synechococcus sp. Nb3U1]|uniref:ABC transporter permease n=1 Tax=Synechococcus sp. Nb3U1 TaxID=1914529 RepID=UPI001F29592E|nr:ABC transporter permease [Synechococcus sp. Nb3U1]MCF2971266.1 ABC transporter permease [Synechococcus sp. Nb3U1]
MIQLFFAELKRSWIQYIRYPVEALGGILITTFFFYALFVGAQYVAGPASQFGERLDAVVIGYVLWTLVIFVVNDIALNLQVEAQTGTLEQVLLSPFSAASIFLARACASFSLRFTSVTAILMVILGLTGSRLQFPPSLILPLVSVVLGAYGLAFLLGSAALIFKRIQQLLVMSQFGLLFLLATPTEEWQGSLKWVGQGLPMTAGAGLLRDVMVRDVGLDGPRLLMGLVTGVVYFALGMAAFRGSVRIAKDRGILGSQ